MCALLLTWLLTFAAVLPTKDKKNPLSPTSLYNKRIHKSPSLLPVQSPPPTAAYQHPSAAGKIFSLIFPIPTKSQTNKTNCSPPHLKKDSVPQAVHGEITQFAKPARVPQSVYQPGEWSSTNISGQHEHLGLGKLTSVHRYCQKGERGVSQAFTTWKTLATSTLSHQAPWQLTAWLPVFLRTSL